MMAALAATTDTVRLGQMCTCNTYRPPSYLAKVAACIDVISGGRLEMGIGAGWYEHEHDGYGYPFLPPGGRLGMLREGVEIMKAMWTTDEVTYEGEHYRLQGAICQPKPVQEPHIPFWIAGGGEKVTLRIAARYAGYTNFGGDDLDTFVRKSEILAEHCKEVGTDFDSITRSANFNILCGATEAEVAEKKVWLAEHLVKHVPEEKAKRSAGLFDRMSGTPDQIVPRLKEYQGAGMGYAIVHFADAAYDRASLELFAREVIPALR
jgi:F420-dependent oxidoreductase-like protein